MTFKCNCYISAMPSHPGKNEATTTCHRVSDVEWNKERSNYLTEANGEGFIAILHSNSWRVPTVTSNLSLTLSLSKPHIMKFHLISLVFLFLTVHHVFSGHLFHLTSCRSLALTLLSVLAPSAQLHQRFGIPFLTLSVHPVHLTLSGAI